MTDCHIKRVCVCAQVWVCHIGFGEGRVWGRKAWQHSWQVWESWWRDKPEQLTSWLDLYVNAREFIISWVWASGAPVLMEISVSLSGMTERARAMIHLFFSILFPSAEKTHSGSLVTERYRLSFQKGFQRNLRRRCAVGVSDETKERETAVWAIWALPVNHFPSRRAIKTHHIT